MTFLNPTYLWTLLALVVPIAIHLWSRKKIRVIKVGSTKFLESFAPKQTSSVKLNEYWLLILRMIGITLLALLLAQPQIQRYVQNTPITYLIEPTLLSDSRFESLIDSLPISSIRILQTGFPEFDRDDRDGINREIPMYWQLAQEMENIASDSIVVFTNALLSGIKGMRPEIKANVQWVALTSKENEAGVIEAFMNEQEVTLLSVTGNTQNLSFKKEVVPITSGRIDINRTKDSVSLKNEQGETTLFLSNNGPLTIRIQYEDSLIDQMRYVGSAYRAIGKFLNKAVQVESEMISDSMGSGNFEQLVWLSEKPAPEYSGTRLLYRPNPFADQLIEPGLRKNTFHVTRSLNVENIVSEHLAEQLVAMMDIHPDLKKKIRPYDTRVIDVSELSPIKSVAKKERKYSQLLDLSPWLWLILAIVLAIERVISKFRRQ